MMDSACSRKAAGIVLAVLGHSDDEIGELVALRINSIGVAVAIERPPSVLKHRSQHPDCFRIEHSV
jgi:hypothetical protein